KSPPVPDDAPFEVFEVDCFAPSGVFSRTSLTPKLDRRMRLTWLRPGAVLATVAVRLPMIKFLRETRRACRGARRRSGLPRRSPYRSSRGSERWPPLFAVRDRHPHRSRNRDSSVVPESRKRY